MKLAALFLCVMILAPKAPDAVLCASEVLEKTPTKIAVQHHPRTGKPYVTVVDHGRVLSDPAFPPEERQLQRPDYRYLDPQVKKGEVLYQGPVSDRRKIYVFAAGLAVLGTAGSLALPVTAVSGAAGGGAGAYAAAGSAVTAGTAAGTVAAHRQSKPVQDENYRLKAESRQLDSVVLQDQETVMELSKQGVSPGAEK